MLNIKNKEKPVRTEKIIQFGEGVFLRGFVDWLFQKLNDSGRFEGSAVIVQPIEQGMCDRLSEQNCLYTHIARGITNGREVIDKTIIDVVSRCVKPYENYDEYLKLAENINFRYIVSNTTEAGIAYNPNDRITDRPPKSFPAKLTTLLYRRYKLGLKGFIILPCELIDNNASTLKDIILRYSKDWNLEIGFTEWLNNENCFCNTLVDRIVTGFPKDEQIELDYIDNMIDTSEFFHLWVIEGDEKLTEELPFSDIGLNVIWTRNLEKYRTRKVRILNGVHTVLTPYALLKGFDTVKSCLDDSEMNKYIKKCLFDEIIPTLDLPEKELIQYANDVLERFSNPYIKHYLSSIALNSVSKFKVRVLPSITEYIIRYKKTPETLVFSLAMLIKFYKTDMANDVKDIMDFMKTADTASILSNTELWGIDLSFLLPEVKKYVD